MKSQLPCSAMQVGAAKQRPGNGSEGERKASPSVGACFPLWAMLEVCRVSTHDWR